MVCKNECVPNKSLIVKMPVILDEYFPHFIRGLFDGDGCITIAFKNKKRVTALKAYIVSASKNFIKDISNKFHSINIKNNIYTISGKNRTAFGITKDYNDCYRIVFNGKNAIKFFNLIYNNDNNLHLERKYQTYLEYTNIRNEELKTRIIRRQFSNPQEILDMLQIYSFRQLAKLYNVTPKTITDRLKKYKLYEQAKNIRNI